MSIKCQICNTEFQKLITSTHLKSHGVSSLEYKNKFGIKSLASNEHRKNLSLRNSGINNPNYGKKHSSKTKLKISEKKQGFTPWNKGLVFDDTTVQQQAATKREERYKLGELVRKIIPITAQTKVKISEGVKLYAASNKDELRIRAKKAVQTKHNNGYDFSGFKGKKHTKKSLAKISASSKKHNKIRSAAAEEKRADLISLSGLVLTKPSTDQWLNLLCIKCGQVFKRTKQLFTLSKFNNKICATCFPPEVNRSLQEKELYDFVLSLCPDAIPNYKFTNSKKEIDIFIPSKNIGIEFNGLYWHSEIVLHNIGYSPKKDNVKYNEIIKAGIRCIVILEDEWQNKTLIVKSRLIHILNKNSKKIYARKCIVKEVSSKIASEFCRQNHLQGVGRSNYRVGLYEKNKDQLIAVMTFSKNNISRKIHEWELNRFCSIPEYSIVGGASKLLTAFERIVKPNVIITYADRRWSQGDVYLKLGFSFISITPPGYWYVRPNECIRYHRYALRKTSKDNQTLTEWENRALQGWNRIWDCGNKKYIKTYPLNNIQNNRA